jgi:hypothetical protein
MAHRVEPFTSTPVGAGAHIWDIFDLDCKLKVFRRFCAFGVLLKPLFNSLIIFFLRGTEERPEMDWIADKEPASAFDFNHNGQIDFNDVVQLFNLL